MVEATVVTVSPLTVRLKGTTTDIPVARSTRLLAALNLQAGDPVLVAMTPDRRYWLVSA